MNWISVKERLLEEEAYLAACDLAELMLKGCNEEQAPSDNTSEE